ncbi:MAG: hypothetical protein GY772_32070, partial [bacterium]|nr:hypothetical protein [bacterium]
MPSAVTELSAESRKGVTKLCVPVLDLEQLAELVPADDHYGAEPTLDGLAVLCWHMVKLLGAGENIDTLTLKTLRHKAEVREVLGEVWFSKACTSNRQAACLLDTARAAGKKKRVYIYRDGSIWTAARAASPAASSSSARLG